MNGDDTNAARQIVEYLDDLRDVPIPEDLDESSPMTPADRLLASAPGFAEVLAEVRQEGPQPPWPVKRGPHGEVRLPDMPDDKALKAKAVELLGLDPKLLELPEMPPAKEPEGQVDEIPEATEAPAPEPPPVRAAQETAGQAGDSSAGDGLEPLAEKLTEVTEKVNEILAYMRLRRDIQTPEVTEADDENVD